MRPHYLAREPGIGIPAMALVMNLLLLLFVGAQLHSATGRLNLTISEHAPAPEPRITVEPSGIASLNGSPMATAADLEFHLSAISANGKSATLELPPSLSASRVAEILQTCTRAGFTDIALQVKTASLK